MKKLLVLVGILLMSCSKNLDKLGDGLYAVISTDKGDIVVNLEYEKTPITVANFVTLAEGKNKFVTLEDKKNVPFYDGLKFHRVIEDFMIQGGDPKGTGEGDPGYKFMDEITDLTHYKGGILSMANAGPNTNGSQFFITHKETPWLDGKHTVFGEVVEGMDVVNSIEVDDVIKSIKIIRNGEKAKKFDAPKVFENGVQAELENQKKLQEKRAQEEAETLEKLKSVVEAKTNEFETYKAKASKTQSGLQYTVIEKGTKKPEANSTVFIEYAGYFENGMLFDSNNAEVSKKYNKYDQQRDEMGGYKGFPFVVGTKEGLIPGFLEAIENMKVGDKVVAFIPSYLGYGEAGVGDVIPPNTNLIFEIKMSPSEY